MAKPSLFLPRFDAAAENFKVVKGALTIQGETYAAGDTFPASKLTERRLMLLHEQRRIVPVMAPKRGRKSEPAASVEA